MSEIVLKDKQGTLRGYANVETIAVKDSDDSTVRYNNISTSKLVASSNETYTAPKGVAYNEVEVNVPNTYTDADEGKVVHNGDLVLQNDVSVFSNGVKDTTLIKQLTVNVPTYGGADVGKVVEDTVEGYHLVAQTSHATVTSNGQYDTTFNDSIDVQVTNTVTYGNDVYNGTIENPFVNVSLTSDIMQRLQNMRNYLSIDASALGLGSVTVAMTNSDYNSEDDQYDIEFNGLICSDDTVSNAQGVDIKYYLSGEDYSTVTLNKCYFLSGGTITDMFSYASVLTTQLTIRKIVLE